MARMKTEGLDDIIQTFNQMADKGQAVQTAMLTSGAEEMTDAWMHAIEDAGHIKTGSMYDNVGYDGIMAARILEPKLTTMCQDTEAIGRIAAEKLIELIEFPRLAVIDRFTVDGVLFKGTSVRELH